MKSGGVLLVIRLYAQLLYALLTIIIFSAQCFASNSPLILEVGDSKILTPGVVDKVAVGDPNIADVRVLSKTEVLVVAKAPGGTNLYVWSGKTTLSYQIIIHPRTPQTIAEEATRAIGVPGITAHSVGVSLILAGDVYSQEMKRQVMSIAKRFDRELIDLVKVVPEKPQVKVKIKMVEASRDAIKELGFDWKADDGGSPITNLIRTAAASNPIEHITDRINAWIDDGKAKLLAEPNLVTVSGTSASFLAGGEIPVPVVIDGQTTIQWKTYGVSLTITPKQEANGDIAVKVRPEVSTLDWSSTTGASANLPAVRKRWAESELKVAPGASVVIAGLLQNEETKMVSRIPFLGSLPVIGALFKSTKYVNRETELLVVVTPSIYQSEEQSTL